LDFTTTGLINQIKRRALTPASQSLFVDNDFIAMLNEELQNRIIPYILSVREDFYLTYDDFTADGVTKEYSIPTHAIGNKINQVVLLQNNQSSNIAYTMIPRLTVSQIDDYYGGYFLEGNKIKIFPNAISSGTIRMYYYHRPAEIVQNADASFIVSINPGVSVTLSVVPAVFSAGLSVDFLSPNQPWDSYKTETPTQILGSTLDLPNTTDISTGDFVALENKAPFAQIPQDLIPLLIQAVVCRIMEYMGDMQGMQAALLTYSQMESDNRNLFSPRIDNQPKKITASNKLSRYMPR